MAKMATSNGNKVMGAEKAANAEIIVEVTPGKTIRLPVESLDGVQFVQEAGNLLVIPADGGEPILLQDFLTLAQTENPPKIELENGDIVEIGEITPLVQGYALSDIEPEAGNEISDGGGASFRSYQEGGIGDPLGINGLLPPTDLAFSRDQVEEIIGVNQTAPGFGAPFPPGPDPDPDPTPPGGSTTVSYVTDMGAAGMRAGGFEDWQPAQNTGDTTVRPMQMTVNFTPENDEQVTDIEISGFPPGTRFFVGGTAPGNEVDVTGGSTTVAAPGGSLPPMYVLPPADSDGDISLTVVTNFANGDGDTGSTTTTETAVIDAVADLPTISGGDASGLEDTPITIPPITVGATDTDGSEALTVMLSGVPAGAILTDGVNLFNGDGTDVDISDWDLSTLTITPPADDDTDFTLTVTATSTEAATVAGGGEITDDNNSATSTLTIDIIVDPVSDTPSVTVSDAAGKEDLGVAADQIDAVGAPPTGDIPLTINLTTGEGGTEDGWVILSGYPAGITFSVGSADADGWRVERADLASLAITGLPEDSDEDFTITVTPYSQDGPATPAAGSAGTINVVIDAVADLPTLTLNGGAGNAAVSGDENTAIDLPDIAATLQDADGSETLGISISGLPSGATLSDGVNSFIGDGNDVDITGWDLANLTVTSATDDDSDFTLTVTTTATEGATVAGGGEVTEADNSASTSFTIDVTVNDVTIPVDDGPTAVDDGPVLIAEPADTHAVFVIDTSASLSQEDIALMEEALKNLATTLFERNPTGTVITLIDFDSAARFIGDGTFYTLDSVLEALDTLDTLEGGGTNYKAALDLTRTVEFEPGFDQEIYFISDGVPTQGNTQGGIDDFNNWVTNDLNDAKVYAVGIGTDAQNSTHLGQIDNTPDDNNNDPDPGDPYLYVDSPADLEGSLTPDANSVSGNVLANDVWGTDPQAIIPITSITYKGIEYDLSDGAESNVTVNGNILTLETDFGILEMNFETGDYSYIANTDVANFETEEFGYTISDDDGSTSSAVLSITITPDDTYIGTGASEAITGSGGNDYIAGMGGDDTLFGGDGDDRFVYMNANTDGNDVIQDFGANGDADVIDLTALFDDLGVAPADRADHVVFSEGGGNTTITVTDGSDTQVSGFSIVVENASLGASDITNGKIVVDES
ncbi:MAG: hypothetical protein CMN55_15855 [Sneathiella sp.]|nr:hypothetical protein [Sneathiella sp.]